MKQLFVCACVFRLKHYQAIGERIVSCGSLMIVGCNSNIYLHAVGGGGGGGGGRGDL